jgi:hypothetical protein
LKSRFEISHGKFIILIPVYGIPHSAKQDIRQGQEPDDENNNLYNMTQIQRQIQQLIKKAYREKELIYVFGDLQDTPDNSNTFHYGSFRLAKHPLGIVNTCENLGMEYTIYQHLDLMGKPIISRHGAKGGRFIDGMYTIKQGLYYVMGTKIIQDTGIFSDHDMVISKLDLGMDVFKVTKEKEESIDFRCIMNIPVTMKPGHHHPVLNENVFKGVEYQPQRTLFYQLQETVKNPNFHFMERIKQIKRDLKVLEDQVIARTKLKINTEEQNKGKFIQRLQEDARIINDASI